MSNCQNVEMGISFGQQSASGESGAMAERGLERSPERNAAADCLTEASAAEFSLNQTGTGRREMTAGGSERH